MLKTNKHFLVFLQLRYVKRFFNAIVFVQVLVTQLTNLKCNPSIDLSVHS